MATLFRHIKRSFRLPSTKKQSDNGEKSESKQSLPQNEKKSRPLISTEARRTASNALYFALKTLSSISNNVPMAGALGAIIEPLLDITSRIEQSSVNAEGLIQLAARIERLAPIVEEMAKRDPDRGQVIILDLQTELASIATDLKAASQRGKLNQFFNSADDASPLSKHNMVLAQMIADSTLVGVQEVLESLRELESSKMQDALSPTVMGDITGGVGGTGGHAQIGGEGGDGDGPQLDIDPDDRYQIGNVSANVLYFALKTLSSISNNVPMAGALSGIIEPLLDITSRIEQSSVNAQGLIQLATRIEHLAPLVEETAKSDPDRGRWIVLELQTELASMTTDLKAASQRGKLNQFFNNADDASPLSKHNMVLAQLIADSKLVGIQEVLKSLRELESSKMEDASSPIVMGDITGGVGSAGGHAQTGGEGGGPQLDMDPDERYQIGNVSGGTGGTGGVGVEVGGKGGTGKGPVISMRRRGSLKF